MLRSDWSGPQVAIYTTSITRVSWFASACVRTQSIAAHRIYVTAMRVARTFVDV